MDSLDTHRFRGRYGPWPGWESDWAAAADLVGRMTLAEKLSLVSAPLAPDPDSDALGSALHTPGIPRLAIPAWDESDASLGVTNPNHVRGHEDMATAFPSTVALGATFNPVLARAMGAALGQESRQKGFSVQLAGGMNLIREPRGGRIFEYVSEDVLLTGIMTGAAVAGIQSEGVVSTLKHFVLNPQETGRVMVSSDISEVNLRESDLLAFEIALEHGQARSVMTAYNLLNRTYASENAFLISAVLKGDWRFKGFVMSDWGATHSTEHAAWAGMDRQSGCDLDTCRYFGEPLRRAIESGRVEIRRLDDMVTRIVAALHSVGALEGRRRPGPTDYEAHARVATLVAEQSIVLLKNHNKTLPLAPEGPRIVVVGGRADLGVLAGGGSSTVMPPGSLTTPGLSSPQLEVPKVHHPPTPLLALQDAFPRREVVRLDVPPADLPAHLRADDVVVLFAEVWVSEGMDAPSLDLEPESLAAIDAVAASAGSLIVVLETAGPVLTPWLDAVDSLLATWYPGASGAAAIARVVAGAVNPAGRLPLSFPCTVDCLPRPTMLDPALTTSFPGVPRQGQYVSVDYDIEGADVGYRWFERTSRRPAFPFGFGLSYTRIGYSDPTVGVGEDGFIRVALTLTNSGDRPGTEVAQVYVAPPTGEGSGTFRLAGWARVFLEPGERRTVRLLLDEERVFSSYDVDHPGWTRSEGTYRVRIARDASGTAEHESEVHLQRKRWSYSATG